MKKITLLALSSALFMAPAAVNAQETTYVEDPAQGYLQSSFRSNWFVEAEGGVGVMFSKWDSEAKFGDRIGAKANLNIGKWFSPAIGLRIGADLTQEKGATAASQLSLSNRPYSKLLTAFGAQDYPLHENGYFSQKFWNLGFKGDVMLNLTNLIGGYRPGRCFDLSIYAGAGLNWILERKITSAAPTNSWQYDGKGYKKVRDSRNFGLRAGLLGEIRFTKRFSGLVDLRWETNQKFVDGGGVRGWFHNAGILLGLRYNFGKLGYGVPVVPSCPKYKYTDAEGDALVQSLEQANRKIADLEGQLRNCLKDLADCRANKPGPGPTPGPVASSDAPLATIYYQIGRSEIAGIQKDVLNAVAGVMQSENNNYVLTGWADNYTGNDKINTKLRKDRVAGVKKALVAKGIADSRLDTQINDGNLTNFGAKCASLDRAVTIVRAK
ncbi:MAG: hypothetical protein IJU62_05355 [Muribaculaceae bacterium]|nr:hypothetical protein [Muribaculaceae bacterium]